MGEVKDWLNKRFISLVDKEEALKIIVRKAVEEKGSEKLVERSKKLQRLLSDFEFIREKSELFEPQALIDDYDLILGSGFPILKNMKNDLKSIQSAIRLSENIIANDPKQISGQFFGRLLGKANPVKFVREPFIFDVPKSLDSLISKLLVPSYFLFLAVLSLKKGPFLLKRYSEYYFSRSKRSGEPNLKRLLWQSIVAEALNYHESFWGKVNKTLSYSFYFINICLMAVFGIKLLRNLRRLSFFEKKLVETKPLLERPMIKGLLEQAKKEQERPWLCPQFASLIEPEGPLTRRLGDHDGVHSVSIMPDGSKVISASSNKLYILDLQTAKIVCDFSEFADGINSIAVTPDGKTIIAALDNYNLIAIESSTGNILRQYVGHSDRVAAIAITPDGQKMVSGSWDTELIIWDLESGRLVSKLSGHTKVVIQIAISPDGQKVISGSDDYSLIVWDVHTGNQLLTLSPLPTDSFRKWIGETKVMPDSTKAVTMLNKESVIVWDLSTGEILQKLQAHKPRGAMVVTPDGERIVFSTDNGDLEVFKASSESFFWEKTFIGNSGWIYSLAVTEDGESLVSVSSDSTIRTWDLSAEPKTYGLMHRRRSTFIGHDYAINDIAITPDGELAISASHDHTLKIWEICSGECLQILAHHSGAVKAVTVTPNGKHGVSVDENGEIVVWSLRTALPCKVHKTDLNIQAVDIAPDGQHLILAVDNRLVFWNLFGWDVYPSESSPLRYIYNRSTQGAYRVAVSKSGKKMISSSLSDGRVIVWNMETEEEIAYLSRHFGDVSALAISSDDKIAISACRDETLVVWDLENSQPMHVLNGHSSSIYSVAFMAKDTLAVSTSEDRTIKVWDLQRGNLLANFTADHIMSCCAVSPDSEVIVAGDYSGRLHFLKLIT